MIYVKPRFKFPYMCNTRIRDLKVGLINPPSPPPQTTRTLLMHPPSSHSPPRKINQVGRRKYFIPFEFEYIYICTTIRLGTQRCQKLRTFPFVSRVPQSKFEPNRSQGSKVMIGQTNRQTEITTLYK